MYLRYALRVLSRNPGFTAVAILSLALGIGANSGIFTLMNALLLRDVPAPHPEQLVGLSAVRPDGHVPFSYPMFQELARGQLVFSDLMAWSPYPSNVEVDGTLSQELTYGVSGNYFSELGVTPLVGRLITPDDVDARNGSSWHVAVLGYDFWRRRFGGTPDVLGKQIHIEGQLFTIVGVTDSRFTGLNPGERPQITVPLTAGPLLLDNFKLEERSILWLQVTGRLKKGLTIAQARAQLETFWPQLLQATTPTQTPGARLQRFLTMKLELVSEATGTTGAGDLRSRFARPLYVLLAIVGLILLLACTNLANLMLARNAARSHEMSVRAALGAGRWSLARQPLTESLLLALVGAGVGLAFAHWGSRLLAAQMTRDYGVVPITLDLRADWRVLSATIALAILTGILFGLIPALHAAGEDPGAALQQNTRTLAGRSGGLGRALIVAQVALSFILVLGAGLLLRTFQKLRSVDLGFEEETLLEVGLNPRPGGYRDMDMNAYQPQLIERITAIPGVRSASFGGFIPSLGARKDSVSLSSSDPGGPGLQANLEMVSPGFFRTLGIRLLSGRDFEWTDDVQHPRVAIVSRALAEQLFPDGGAIGQRIRFGFISEFQALEIVGIVENARLFDPHDSSTYVVYLADLQNIRGAGERATLLIRSAGDPEALARTVAGEIEFLGHEYALRTRTAPQLTALIFTPERVTAMLSGFFAGLALLLVSVGLYGLISYTVTRRTREIGIRVALGAQRESILWMVLRETLALVLLGVALGLPCALAAGRLLAGMLFGLSPNDPVTAIAAALVLLAVGLLAGYLPARRAAVLDPILALRTE